LTIVIFIYFSRSIRYVKLLSEDDYYDDDDA